MGPWKPWPLAGVRVSGGKDQGQPELTPGLPLPVPITISWQWVKGFEEGVEGEAAAKLSDSVGVFTARTKMSLNLL